jgi:fido (protein-threonine AMPylation protein)
MRKRVERPADDAELKDREAAGLWRAIALSRKLAEDRAPLTLETLKAIHHLLLVSAFADVAGRFRRDDENVKKLACTEPPPGRVVAERTHAWWKEFEVRLSQIPLVEPPDGEVYEAWLEQIFDLATWAQYQIAAIHPFCDGNGRMARLLTNMILIRFGLPPTRVRFEGENKAAYLNALCQVDRYNDYAPLRDIIIEGALETLRKEEKRRSEAQQG